ncbi:MAG TPA: glycosyltransferase [Candidatus Limiplasma sp.]|nr:glycosyltransferase [Candidatus Limiplasma sp.]HRX08649.1 glycosyltransferase [Candidatus Limiplasma sp.]
MIFEGFAEVLYGIGLFLVFLYLAMSLDDFIWDIVTTLFRRFHKKQRLDFKALETIPPKLLAVTVAAWHEDAVLGDVIDNFIESTSYPRSMYHIFLGIYPNDAPTLKVAEELAERHDNVHVIINDMPGPTSKAQNINHVIRQIRVFEQEHGWAFASLTIHDSEDVVHPYELLVTNYLLETHDALQFPVFPLIRMPKFSNFFQNITTGTYADEFAENHYTTMVNRYIARAFVPSAGTGFALSRKTLASFGDEDVLPRNSLTEDYRLSLTLFEKNIRLYYVLERIPRISNRGKVVWDYVTTRSMFPNTFKTAVKQKTRWTLGITMQSVRFKDIFQTKTLHFMGRYSLYKDTKAKVGNLVSMIGYPVLIYFFASLIWPLQPIFPLGSLSWYLSLVVTGMMLERQLFRGISIYHVYGMRSVFFAVLFPPVFPIRLIWGNIINMVATVKAFRQRRRSKQKKDKKQPAAKTGGKAMEIKWSKTDHAFLDQQVLKRYRRTIGDILLERGYVSTDVLQKALPNAKKNGERLGEYLLKHDLIGEDELLDALSRVIHSQHVSARHLSRYGLERFADQFDELLLRSLHALPLMVCEGGFICALCDESPRNAQEQLESTYGIHIKVVIFTRLAILRGLDIMFSKSAKHADYNTPAYKLYEAGKINCEQVILVRNYTYKTGRTETQILREMGLLPEAKSAKVVYSGLAPDAQPVQK